MKYIDLINLGFKRKEYDDSAHFEQYGYKDFDLNFKLSKRHAMVWKPTDQDVVTLHKFKPDGIYIEKSYLLEHIDDVKMLVNMFG